MAGFLPLGREPIAIIREIWGVDALGARLAKGGVLAFVQIDGQPWESVPAAMWEGEQAREWVEQGAVISPNGERFPIILESTVVGYPLSDLVKAYKADQAARSEGLSSVITRTKPPAPNKGGRPARWDWEASMLELSRLAAEEGTANKTSPELMAHLRGWFIDRTGDSPSESQLRERVGKFKAATET